MSACLHAAWELAKLLQQTQHGLTNPEEFMREIRLPTRVFDIQK